LYLANCYDHLWTGALRGRPENDGYLLKAERNYQLAAQKLLAENKPDSTQTAKSALEMLSALYAPDKLHNAARARAVFQELIRLDPADTSYYFSLARLFEDAEMYANAEPVFLKAAELKPNDPGIHIQVATHYWDISDHGSKLTDPERIAYAEKGLAAADRALALMPDDVPALAVKVQLYKAEASAEKDKKKIAQLNAQADAIAAKIKTLRASQPQK